MKLKNHNRAYVPLNKKAAPLTPAALAACGRIVAARSELCDLTLLIWCEPALVAHVVFPSSSSLNGHPGRPGKRATGGGARPGARGPGRGPTVVWAQPGCLGAFSSRAPPRSQWEIRSQL